MVGEKTLEYGRLARARWAGNDDGAVFLSCLILESAIVNSDIMINTSGSHGEASRRTAEVEVMGMIDNK